MSAASSHTFQSDPLDGITLLDELGHGSGSVVHRARRGSLEFAVKVLRERPDSAQERASYQREAAVLANVHHPGLVRIHAVGELEGRPALVMDLVRGETLQTLLARCATLDEPTAVGIALDAAGALAAAHATGLVHRDVKPANLIVQPDGHARLIDFGLVARVGTQQSRDATIGTVRYSPPEQTGLLGRAVDGRSDLYALGVVLFEMIAGHPPFEASDVGELVRCHAAVPAPDLLGLTPDVSPALAAVVARLLAKDPDDRYQTADGLAHDLERIMMAPAGKASFAVATHDDPRAAAHDLELIGRDQELSALVAGWHRAQRGHGSVALVDGGPGIGKRRLLRALVAQATDEDALDLTGRALPDDPTPLAALREAIDLHLNRVALLGAEARERALGDLRAAVDAAGDAVLALSPRLATLTSRRADAATDMTSEQHAAAIARFFVELATRHGSAVLRLIDVAYLDETSVQVLAQLAVDLPTTPLLVVATGREDEDSRNARVAFERAFGDLVATRLTLGALDEDGTRGLLRALLGGVDVDPGLVTQLHHRSGGNPFALQEYVRAITHAGLVRPSWGELLIDRTGLDRLALPDDVMDLVLTRIDQLGEPARRLLAAAAVAGHRFSPDIAAQAAGLSAQEGADACTEILAERLVERRTRGRLAFVHERVRQAVMAPLDEVEHRSLHSRLADVLEAGTTPNTAAPDLAYAIAHHLTHAGQEGTAERRLAWNLRAAHAALDGHSAARSSQLFETAQRAADELHIRLGVEHHERWAVALVNAGDPAASDRHIDHVLEWSSNGALRARVLLLRSRTCFSNYDATGAASAADEGLAALGRSLPTGRLRRLFMLLASTIMGFTMLATGRGVGSAPEDEREHLALESDLLGAAGQACYIHMQPLGVAFYTLMALPRAARLGPSRQLAHGMAAAAPVVAAFGAEKTRAKLIDGAQRTAVAIENPSALAYVALYRFLSLETGGRTRDAGAASAGLLAEHGRWLETADLLLAAGAISYNLDLRGHTREALREWQSVHARMLQTSTTGVEQNPYLLMGWISMEMLGQRSEAAQLRLAVQELGREEEDPYRRQLYLGALIRYLRDQNEYGPELLDAIDASDALGIDPRTANPWVQANFTQPFETFVELAERATSDTEREQYLDEARRRWKIVRRARCVPLFQTNTTVAHANLLRVSGEARKAERELRKAERLAVACDHLRAHYEIARARALLARDAGEEAEARRQGQIAMRLAADHGWGAIVAGLRRDLGPIAGSMVPSSSAPSPGASHSDVSLSASVTGVSGGVGSLRGRRTLDALLSLSVAASHAQGPDELARVSLDHVVALLGAERGFLFLTDDNGLQLSAVRDASGEDIPLDDVRWSRTVIDRAVRTCQPVLITGSEDAAAVGAESAVQYGLRSILACPLLLEGRLLGVLTVDSRLARGIFGAGDSDILSAIGSQIAVALETARATQLELAVATEREQRGLAEALRDAMSDISSTLDPVEVLERTLERAWRVLHYDRAAVLMRDASDRWTVSAVAGDIDLDGARDGLATEQGAPFLAALTATSTPEVVSQVVVGGSPAERILGPSGAWMSVPLIARGELAGVMLMATDEPGHLGEAQLDIAATFAGQGLIAHENARLFTAVERMATTDELTQVNNRRHFFDLGETQFLTAQRYELPLATLMLDIDHFKHVNDTHGHAAGDDVICEVARRLHGLIRTVDIIGRYGGEEFAFVLPCTGDDAVVLAERLRESIAAKPIATCAGDIHLTASIGVAVFDGEDPHLAAILGRADLALYEAKRLGRDRVHVAGDA